jgi:iron-sulfur cluster repair protein YtfE (RIC family)
MKNPAPIKRHQPLVSFSKDHHFGLLLVWKIRQGLKKPVSPDRITDYVLYFFKEDLDKHFKAEETLLFSKLQAEDLLRKQAEKEHREINSLVTKLTTQKQDASLLMHFADALENHIRFEERELFNHLQDNIAAPDLEEAALHMSNDSRAIDEKWPDPFWQQ